MECHGAQFAFRDSMIHVICNSHYLSHFAASFIDGQAKRSVVESFVSLKMIFCKSILERNTKKVFANLSPGFDDRGKLRCKDTKCTKGSNARPTQTSKGKAGEISLEKIQ